MRARARSLRDLLQGRSEPAGGGGVQVAAALAASGAVNGAGGGRRGGATWSDEEKRAFLDTFRVRFVLRVFFYPRKNHVER
jgi:hypothetical protein